MPNYSGLWSGSQQFQGRGNGLWPATPGAPTSVSATAGLALCASVSFTAPVCRGVPNTITNYLVISTPGCITATGTSSPVVVTGLTCNTSYTFKVQARNNSGYGALSAASNSISAKKASCATYTTPGTYTWVAPAGVTSVSAMAVGGGGSGRVYVPGGAGGLGWRNNISVTPGNSYTVVVGAGGTNVSSGQCGSASYFINACTVRGGQGAGGNNSSGGGYTGQGGGNGGNSAGGAGGYSGAGGNGNSGYRATGFPGTGGGGGGGGSAGDYCAGCCQVYFVGSGGGGGVGLYGQGANGSGGAWSAGGGGGSGGSSGGYGGTGSPAWSTCGANGGYGGSYGGGGGYGNQGSALGGVGGNGAVRIVWYSPQRGTPAFPSTNVGPS